MIEIAFMLKLIVTLEHNSDRSILMLNDVSILVKPYASKILVYSLDYQAIARIIFVLLFVD